MLAIADMVYHTHFHLIPKHPNLTGMGKYCFRVLEVIEGYKNTPQDEQDRMAKMIGSLVH
jgi:diadenosine tetraphosphate (Ap4A) HIT family hydrolase